jgi:nitrogen fixation/metabolism regulation signal transduction histidine kinase
MDMPRRIYQEQLATLRMVVGLMAFFGVFMAVAFWLVIDVLITRRIAVLSERVKGVSEAAYTHTVEVIPGSDEVSFLSIEISKMLKRVDDAHQESEKSRMDLEKRTDELEVRTQELEKTNKAMIGRELKMAELKHELAQVNKCEIPPVDGQQPKS